MQSHISILDGLNLALDDNPNDVVARTAMADLLDDNGQTEVATAVRWAVRHGKRPYTATPKEWTWFNQAAIPEGLEDDASDIPEAIYKELRGFAAEKANHRKWPSRKDAEAAFVAAYSSAVKKGWNPGSVKPTANPLNDQLEKEQAKERKVPDGRK